jgi:nucleoside-diphosphate-sugar epimerase
VRVPHVAAIAASAVVARLPFVPGLVEWLHAVRAPVVMDTTKAKTVLGWTPKYSSAQTLEALAQSR